MAIKEKDFVNIDFDVYSNGKLSQSTSQKTAETAGLPKAKSYAPQLMVVGKGFFLKALDEDMLKSNIGEKRSLELSVDEAFGKRQKDHIKTFPKKVFDEKKIRAVAGMVYDFNGMFGTVKSVVGGRVMVDFNNPYAGKELKIDYTITSLVTDIKVKLGFVFTTILKMPKTIVKISVSDKSVSISIPKELHAMSNQFTKTFEDYISDIKDYSIDFTELAKPKK
jgi:FKBP-type peptidyl-prolyl cis-trans isomerase 2